MIIIGWDTEYQTQWLQEVQFLKEHGIRYTWVKTVDGITIWKYKKNVHLFLTLASFYENVYTK